MRNRSLASLKRQLPTPFHAASAMPIPIQRASQASGVSLHVIRIWERRYNALNPSRTCTNRRMYCDEAVLRLKLLRALTENGQRIGRVARLCTSELEELVSRLPSDARVLPSPCLEKPEHFIEAALAAAKQYDPDGLRCVLQGARRLFGLSRMLPQVVCPLIIQMRVEWQQGSLRPGHERIATIALREVLLTPSQESGGIPALKDAEIVVAAPVGELHEPGALVLAASAREQGWRVTYLGPNLPVEEIAACAIARKVHAVALSVAFPEKCPVIESKLRRLREMLPAAMHLLVGGCAAESYSACLTDPGIQWAGCLDGLTERLRKIQA